MTEKTPIQRFYEKGQEFIARAKQAGPDPCVAIKQGMEEWNSWATYFQRTCGSLPAAMRDVERGVIASMTVPAQWPEWFDPDYRAPDQIPARESRWKTVPHSMRVLSFGRVMARVAREPLPPEPTELPPAGTEVTWNEVPNGTRLVGRHDRTWKGAVKNPVIQRGQRQAPGSLEASDALLATLASHREAAE